MTKRVALRAAMLEAVSVGWIKVMTVRLNPILFDCLIVLAGTGVLVGLSFMPPGPWLYVPAALGVLGLTVAVLRKFSPTALEEDFRSSEQSTLPSFKGDR